MTQAIGTLGTVDKSVNIGGRNLTSTGLIVLTAAVNISGSNKYTSFRNGSTTSGYQVTAGKTFTAYAWQAFISIAAAGTTTAFSYSTADAGVNQASAPAGNVFIAGYDTSVAGFIGNNTTGLFDGVIYFTVAQNDYINIYANGGAVMVTLFGYEA